MTDLPSRLSAALQDRYALERKLGEGGMATVYLAQDLKHDRKVALKVLKPELAAVVGGDRFIAEIRTTANLQHPHILPLFDSGQDDGMLWFVMPFIEGETLADRLAREKQLPVEEAVAIAAKVAGALQAAHDQGIIHRDIKPANILLANGEPLVADFGIALAVQEAGGGRLTETGLSVGTPYYMSPEQATAERAPDARADVYSLGCVLYEMLAGDPPFTGSSAQAVLGRILTQPAPVITDERPTVPANVAAAVYTAIQKLPADRFASAADFARALRSPAPAGTLPGFAAPAGAASGRGLLPWTVAAVATVVALALALRGLTPSGDADGVPVRFTVEASADITSMDWQRVIAVSDDGSTVAFTGRDEAGRTFLRRDLSAAEVVPIPGTRASRYPAISPDGRWVAGIGDDGQVYRVPLEGGSPERLGQLPNPPIGISWNGNGRLEFGMLAFDSDYSGLTSLDVATGALEVRTLSGDDDGMHHEPVVLPGGSWALFIDFPEDRSRGLGLGVIDLETNDWRRLDLGGARPRGTRAVVGASQGVLLFIDASDRLMAVRWDESRGETLGEPVAVDGVPGVLADAVMSPTGTLVLLLAGEAYRAVIMDDRGRVVREMWDGPVNSFHPRVGPDPDRVAVALGDFRERNDVWIWDGGSGGLTPVGIGQATPPTWTPDGREILSFQRTRISPSTGLAGETRGARILATAVDGSAAERELLILPGQEVEAADLRTSDGTLVVTKNQGPNPSMRQMDVGLVPPGVDSLVPLAAGPAQEVAPRLSPDGRWLAYTAVDAGRAQVFVRGFPDGDRAVPVSPGEGGMPVWDPSGRRIYYRTPDGLAAATVTVESGTLRVTAREPLFSAAIYGQPGMSAATYDVHPEGFVLALDEARTAGRIVVWKDWIQELEGRLGR